MVKYTPEEIGAKMDSLGLWKLLVGSAWAVKPAGMAMPYFCLLLKGDKKPVKVRFLMLEGWQTFLDFLHARIDPNYAFYSSPIEFPHYEMVMLEGDPMPKLFRHDTGYMPTEVSSAERRSVVARILWEAYGVMMRVEADRSLLMQFSGKKSILARIEDANGKWSDQPLEIPDGKPHVEQVVLPKELIAKAKDLPLVAADRLELDFRMRVSLMTKEPRPRCVYNLVGIDDASGRQVIDGRVSVHPEGGLRAIWETMPVHLLSELVRIGKVPGEIRVLNMRMFRLIRPICFELPIKLTLHDKLERIDALFA